ncbi:MAG: ATP-dependent Clp protease ATP-binding subunit ClpX [Spongiibacteraceae bacterium]
MADDNKPRCSFCGVEKSADVPLIAGAEGRICEACVVLAHQVVSSWGQRRKSKEVANELRTPAAIKLHLDDYVIGQDTAKETLAVAVYNHYLRLINQDKLEPFCDQGSIELEKSNVLMAGPSGTGKTLLVKSLARILGVPIVIADATTLTQAGYVGDDVDTVLARLLEAADGDVQRAQWGIVYIDEIDKIAKRGGGGQAVRDIGGEGVQQALLKMVEGAEIKLPKSGRKREGGEEVVIDTTNILFIVGGAFPGLEELIASRVRPEKRGIGFHAQEIDRSELTTAQLMEAMQPDDLQKFGLIPEFVGRFPVITFLRDLDVSMLLRILTEPRNALVKQYKQLFAYQKVELDFADNALQHIAEEALKRGTGARGLRGIVEAALRHTMFELPEKTHLRRCTIEADDVLPSGLRVSEIFDENSSDLIADPKQADAKQIECA